MKKVFTVCLLSFFFSPALRAVGIPIPDTTTPIKVSVSKNYKCDDKGNAFSKQDNGDYNLMKGITCHNDNLWRDGKAMNFIDMINYVADEYHNARLEKEHLLSSKPEAPLTKKDLAQSCLREYLKGMEIDNENENEQIKFASLTIDHPVDDLNRNGVATFFMVRKDKSNPGFVQAIKGKVDYSFEKIGIADRPQKCIPPREPYVFVIHELDFRRK